MSNTEQNSFPEDDEGEEHFEFLFQGKRWNIPRSWKFLLDELLQGDPSDPHILFSMGYAKVLVILTCSSQGRKPIFRPLQESDVPERHSLETWRSALANYRQHLLEHLRALGIPNTLVELETMLGLNSEQLTTWLHGSGPSPFPDVHIEMLEPIAAYLTMRDLQGALSVESASEQYREELMRGMELSDDEEDNDSDRRA